MSKGIESSVDDLLEPGSQVKEVASGGVHAPDTLENATPPLVPGYPCCDHCTSNDSLRFGNHSLPCHVCKQCDCH